LGETNMARSALKDALTSSNSPADRNTRWWAATLDLHLRALQIEQDLHETIEDAARPPREIQPGDLTIIAGVIEGFGRQIASAPDEHGMSFALQARLHGWYALRRAIHRLYQPPGRFMAKQSLRVSFDLERLKTMDVDAARSWAECFGVVLRDESTR
jgi:hypothetical protein